MQKWVFILALIPLLSAPSVRADGDKPEPLAVVVKKGSPVNQLGADELAKIFKGTQTKSADGTRFVLTMREGGSSERAAFLTQVLQMSEAQYQKYFLQSLFTGLVKVAPKVLTGPDAVKSFVQGTDGAIGYIKLSDVDASVTVVSIDGKKPGDDGYPLSAN